MLMCLITDDFITVSSGDLVATDNLASLTVLTLYFVFVSHKSKGYI